jgi:ribosome-associated translation inhibitor RaiA
MTIQPDITFRNMEPSAAVEDRIRERLIWLMRVDDRITSARIRVEAPHRSRTKGKIYHVSIALMVPGRPEMVISHEPEVNHAHEDIYIAIRDAFDAARRRLREGRAIRAGHVKTHKPANIPAA